MSRTAQPVLEDESELLQNAENTSTRLPYVTLEPARGWATLGLRDCWQYRELLYFMVWREVQGRYRQTALGMTWLFIRPIVSVFVFSVIFGGLLRVPSDGVPYPLFSLSAMLVWSYFSNALSRSASSLVSNMNIISKVYFPRLLIPVSSVLSGLVDFVATLTVFFVALLVYRMPLRMEMIALPFFLLVAICFSLGFGLWLATLAVKYRDVSFALGFITQTLMYASPVIYPVSLVPERLRLVYQLNPMTGVIEGFRWALLGSNEAPGGMFFVQIVLVILVLISGAFVFRRTERTVVDIL